MRKSVQKQRKRTQAIFTGDGKEGREAKLRLTWLSVAPTRVS